MRAVVAFLAIFLAAACASHPSTATKADCQLEEGGVYASMTGTSWHRLIVTNSEPVVHGTHIGLSYVLNLDPDPMVDRRDYASLADHGNLVITFGRQFRPRAGRPDDYIVEIHDDEHSMTRTRNRYGQAWFRGDDLDAILGGADDVHIFLRNAQGDTLREERITRSELIQVDALMSRLSAQIRELLVDPARLCAPEEEIVVT